MKELTLVVDFDGTIVTMDYPRIGTLMTGAKETLAKWKEQGHTIVVGTCRSGAYELEAYQFLINNEIPFDFFNENDPALIQKYGTDTRKYSGDVYFDDKAVGGFCGWKRADKYVQHVATRKPVIICIVGASGAGKTTISKYIEQNFGVKMIESRTTRPKRNENEVGHTFVSDSEFDTYKQDDMLAWTDFGNNRYCCLKQDVLDENTYVLDEKGLAYLKENFGSVYDIKTMLVTCNKSERIERVGAERVARDEGRFNMQRSLFDFVWETDSRKDHSARREQEFEQLDNFIIKSLGRGWC